MVGFEFEDFVGEVDALIEQAGIVVAEAEVLVRAGVFGAHVDGLFEAAHGFGVAAELGKKTAEVEEDIGLVGCEFEFGEQILLGQVVVAEEQVSFAESVMGAGLVGVEFEGAAESFDGG